ncbi:Acetyl-CoA synthetase-like protein [Venustampulla echinocandica]|uniref:Acetyl-CoA synthetase-like protein n=1 Tax=Venustampulla echinocandica TaxID=2656787 RepID=A0A370TSI5_9HELO|nr:Acetyl-CoA synthetase-like protein [Venustampulla echinocandica]RDL38497.1 Acetyl-CoA synthetase-like protein [Venustampulla echinocandica]
MIDPPLPEKAHSNMVPQCSDPSVIPSDKASRRTKDLWRLHGDPHSQRYSNPKLVSLAALVRHDSVVYQGQNAFLYPLSADSDTRYESMTWDEFDRVTEVLALSYAGYLEDELAEGNLSRKQPTVALLGGGKTIEYFCTLLALQKLGVRVLLLAESNTVSALHHLLETCHVLAVITDLENRGVDKNGVRSLAMIEVLPRSLEVNYMAVDAIKFQDVEDVWERHAFIIHSSGSTGRPKPIIHTNRSMMLIARMYRLFQEFDIENWFLLFPLYHIAGVSIALSGLPNGQVLSFPPQTWPPASSAIFAAWNTLSSIGYPVDCVHCAPTLIENMYEYICENGGDFTPLVSLKLLQPGGAALSDSIIKALTANGVNVKTTYGSTEIGPPFRSIPHTRDNTECYSFRNLYPDNPFITMEEVTGGTYECVVFKGFELAAELWQNTDEPYRTNDLFIQDPPESGFFILKGRKDDMLVHSNGEKTIAGPLQLDIQTSCKVISKALAFGHSKPYAGLLVEVCEAYDPKNDVTRSKIWGAVEQVNTRYPKHSQIMEDMICILPKGKLLPVTPKGNIKRKEAERLYWNEIERLYSDGNPVSTPSSSSSEAARIYIYGLLSNLSNTPVSDIQDWTSLFDLGMDSRLALRLRKSLSSHFHRTISLSALFENPSVSKLVSIFSRLEYPFNGLHQVEKPPPSETLNRLISKLEAEFKSWPKLPNRSFPLTEKETILVTGASGFLGTELLCSLSALPRVEKVYAMVRGVDHLAKLSEALESRGMDPSILNIENGGKIEAINFGMQDPFLGLDLGTMSLLRFCHAGRPKRLAFTSSISACMGTGYTSLTVPEEPVGPDPSVALPTGYAQSKYIAERITQTAARTLHIPIHIFRVGQLTGSTVTGHWNVNDMWAVLFATSLHPLLSAIPSFPSKHIDWVPINIAATVIADILMSNPSPSAPYTVHNITNPHPTPYPSLITHFLTLTGNPNLQSIPMKEWTSRLSALADSNPEIPGVRLLPFFEMMADLNDDSVPSKVFETAKTRRMSVALRECGPFCREWLEAYVRVWKEQGFLE